MFISIDLFEIVVPKLRKLHTPNKQSFHKDGGALLIWC